MDFRKIKRRRKKKRLKLIDSLNKKKLYEKKNLIELLKNALDRKKKE